MLPSQTLRMGEACRFASRIAARLLEAGASTCRTPQPVLSAWAVPRGLRFDKFRKKAGTSDMKKDTAEPADTKSPASSRHLSLRFSVMQRDGARSPQQSAASRPVAWSTLLAWHRCRAADCRSRCADERYCNHSIMREAALEHDRATKTTSFNG